MKPLILITNDDGIFSPGLKAVAEAVEHLGELLIVAPRFQQTSMGRAFPVNDKTGVIDKVKLNINGREILSYGVYGSPAQAVAHAILEISELKPNLCISGINYGENLGLCLTCSGTLGAAFEAVSNGIPAIAVSIEAHLSVQHSNDFAEQNWSTSKRIIENIAGRILKNRMPDGVNIFNINVPESATENTEMRVTRQSRANYFVFRKPLKRDFNKPFKLTTELKVDIDLENKNTDVYAVYADRAISITPLNWDFTSKTDFSDLISYFKNG